MIYSNIIFPISQRIFWRRVRKKRDEWNKKSLHLNNLDAEIFGIRVRLNTSDALSKFIFAGDFEWAETEWIIRYLKPGMVVYDIGANIGYYTLLSAKITGSSGKVYSVEPSQNNFHNLCENINLNPVFKNIISVNKLAVSDINGVSQIYSKSKELQAWNSLIKPGSNFTNDFETITTKKIDFLFQTEKWLPPSLIKIDVEGMEPNVLKGAKETISRYRPTLLIEFTRENLERAEYSYETLQKILLCLNYKIYEFTPRFRKLIPVINWEFEHKNLIALPEND